ncbi:MAG TPA: adenosylcobinamide-GDP ribazoletransferase [Aeromicrobium sp.]|nr:adenosylcobinamide-GDP ribazoletransferase [Aeromicrobium sp.]
MGDGLRLAVGTLTALPVRPPTQVDQRTARTAVLLAPPATLPLGLAVAATLWLTHLLGVDPLASGLLAVGVLALGSRALHLDGLADTADGLTSSYDRERSLAVMKSGVVGPAGVAALIVVLGIQVVGFAGLSDEPLAAGALVLASRAALALTCMRGVPAAAGEGLRSAFAGSVSWPLALLRWLSAAAIAGVVLAVLGMPWQSAIVGFAIATVLVGLLIHRAITRLGGVTGDVFGAAIELTLATLLVVAA